jgi:EpsI family protein
MRISMRRLMIGAAPALILLLGWLGRGVIQPNRTLSLAAPLSEFPERLAGFESASSQPLGEDELRVLRADDYLNREYRDESGRPLRLSVAFFGRQLSGVSVHSPRNCLPGSGWSPIDHERSVVETPYGDGSVNRYVVEHESGARAVVYYWYQGRGRVEANEYLVKWDLLRDAVLKRRTDEALVRLVFPVRRDESLSSIRAFEVVREVARALAAHLPA